MTTNRANPSFSSSLLDEIYRSIDAGDDKFSKKQSSVKCSSVKSKARSSIEDEEMASFRRACLIEKWMDKKVAGKVTGLRQESLPEFDNKSLHYNDHQFFSSSSSCSDSSSGGFSSESESFRPVKTRPTSCFTAGRIKPIRTGGPGKSSATSENSVFYHEQRELYMFDDLQKGMNKTEDGLIKSKIRALKIYENLKKVKQPISPGGKLSSFLNSLFTNGSNSKKTKSLNSNGGFEENAVERKDKFEYKSTQSSMCSSASSFSRSCLSKTSHKDRMNTGIKRTVSFYPVSVIVDEDCRPCGHKRIYEEDAKTFGRRSNEDRPKPVQKNYSKSHLNQKQNQLASRKIVEEEDYDDGASDSSSDLFELDHLALFRNDRFREELPVYETTHLDTNRAIASGLIR
ncbi:hypothetical protein LguiB_009638 [Lonicera macranthoides]